MAAQFAHETSFVMSKSTSPGFFGNLRSVRPRWIDDDRTIKGDRIGYTLIAKWRPWVYYRIITFRVHGSSRIQRMISSLDTGLPLDEAPTRPDYFATVAMRCNRYGQHTSEYAAFT